MSISMTQQNFRALGLQIDPDDPTQAIPVAHQAESVPDESWDLERLGNYAATGLSEASRLQKESIQLGRRSTVQIFRSGHALSIARRKVPWGDWGRWLKEHDLKRTTAWEAIELYQRAGSEEAIANLTPSQAKKRYGIGRPPRSDTEESGDSKNHSELSRPLNPSSDSASQSEDESDYEEPEDADLNRTTNRMSWYAHSGPSETCLSRQVTYFWPVSNGQTRSTPLVATSLPRSTPV